MSENWLLNFLSVECLLETECAPPLPEDSFMPAVYVDILKFVERKIAIIKLYRSQTGSFPFPRSETGIRALANFRGMASGF